MEALLNHVSNHPVLSALLAVSLAMVIGVEIRGRGRRGTDLTPAEAVRAINDGGVVVDVRGTSTFEQGHIIDAVNVPLSEMEQKIGSLQKHKNGTLLVCCDNGLTAGKAAGLLREQGFPAVTTLKGGLNAWRQEGLPLQTGKARRRGNDE